MNDIEDEGWGWPPNANKSHYFQSGKMESVCGRWMYVGSRFPDNFESKDDCKPCRRWITKNVKKDTQQTS